MGGAQSRHFKPASTVRSMKLIQLQLNILFFSWRTLNLATVAKSEQRAAVGGTKIRPCFALASLSKDLQHSGNDKSATGGLLFEGVGKFLTE